MCDSGPRISTLSIVPAEELIEIKMRNNFIATLTVVALIFIYTEKVLSLRSNYHEKKLLKFKTSSKCNECGEKRSRPTLTARLYAQPFKIYFVIASS